MTSTILFKLREAIKNKKIVIVAGAGISKDPPGNLPSWFDITPINFY